MARGSALARGGCWPVNQPKLQRRSNASARNISANARPKVAILSWNLAAGDGRERAPGDGPATVASGQGRPPLPVKAERDMARLLSLNIGLPRDIAWKGRTVHTGIWKTPVNGRCRVGRLNLDGDGQGDLAGHGGE